MTGGTPPHSQNECNSLEMKHAPCLASETTETAIGGLCCKGRLLQIAVSFLTIQLALRTILVLFQLSADSSRWALLQLRVLYTYILYDRLEWRTEPFRVRKSAPKMIKKTSGHDLRCLRASSSFKMMEIMEMERELGTTDSQATIPPTLVTSPLSPNMLYCTALQIER